MRTFASIAVVTALVLGAPFISVRGVGLFAELAASQPPTIELDPPEFPMTEAGGTAGPMTATVRNSSHQSITISDVSLDDETNFTIPLGGDQCSGQTLRRKDDSCTIAIQFQPQTAGHISTTLSFFYASSKKASTTVAGTAYVPPVTPSAPSVDFGQKTVDSGRETRTVTLTNNALIPLGIASITVVSSEGTTPFDAEQGCVATIAAGAACDLILGFAPAQVRNYAARVVIRDEFAQDIEIDLAGAGTPPGQPDIGLSTTALEFGRVQVGAAGGPMPVTLVSTGTADVTITDILASGDFAVANAGDCIKALAPAQFCTIQATFTPSVGGERTGQVSITDDAPDSPQVVSLSGAGVDPGQPSVDLSATALDFGSQTVGTTGETLYVVLSNVGGADLAVSDVAASGDFSELNDCVGSVPAGARCGIAVTFAPTATGERAGELVITDDAAGSPHAVALAGAGTEPGAPQASLSASSLNFGAQPVGASSTAQTLTLTNTGDSDLAVGLTAIDGEGASSYGKRDRCRETAVEPGASCSIDIVFTPQDIGTLSAVLSIDDNTGDSPHAVLLMGSGTPFPSGGGGCSLGSSHAGDAGFLAMLMVIAAIGTGRRSRRS